MNAKFLLSIVSMCAVTAAVSFAQGVPAVKLPPSPAGHAAVQLGGSWQQTSGGGRSYRDGKWIVIDYGRPILRGRTNIFGSGADYGKAVSEGAPVWRVGANNTTRLTTQLPLEIGGKALAPGVYNVLAELKPGAWSLVLTTQPIQETYDPNEKVKLYGSYNYDPTFDVLRAPMTVRSTDQSMEQLTVGFVNATETGVTLMVWWEKTMATVDLRLAAGTK